MKSLDQVIPKCVQILGLRAQVQGLYSLRHWLLRLGKGTLTESILHFLRQITLRKDMVGIILTIKVIRLKLVAFNNGLDGILSSSVVSLDA